MSNPYPIDIRIEIEALISEREGMIAENNQRIALGQSMAYVNDSFLINAENFRKLLKKCDK